MNQDFIPYLQIHASIDQPYAIRKRIVALAVGYAAACNCPMPSSKVSVPTQFFMDNHAAAVRKWVSFFNEVSPMDCVAATDAAMNFWMMRYNAVHNCPSLDIVPGDFFQSLFGAPNQFSVEMLTTLNTYNVVIAPLYRAACLAISKWASE